MKNKYNFIYILFLCAFFTHRFRVFIVSKVGERSVSSEIWFIQKIIGSRKRWPALSHRIGRISVHWTLNQKGGKFGSEWYLLSNIRLISSVSCFYVKKKKKVLFVYFIILILVLDKLYVRSRVRRRVIWVSLSLIGGWDDEWWLVMSWWSLNLSIPTKYCCKAFMHVSLKVKTRIISLYLASYHSKVSAWSPQLVTTQHQ